MRRERGQPDDWRRFHTMSQLGAALAGQKKCIEAEPMLLKGYEGMKVREAKIPAPSKKRLAEAAARIAPFYEAWGKPKEAADWRAKLARVPRREHRAEALKPRRGSLLPFLSVRIVNRL